MVSVSLIVLDRPGCPVDDRRLGAWEAALSAAGYEVEVVVVGPGAPAWSGSSRHVASRGQGTSADAVDGLRAASGDVRVVIDAARTYAPADLPRLIAPLVEGRAEVGVGVCRHRGWRALASTALRPLSGSVDPFSGLLALTREAFERVDDDFKPVGGRFALEILARARWNRADVAVDAERSTNFPTLGLDDLRHIKRIADDRLGNVSRLLQFCVVGASGMVIDLTLYALFQWVFARTWMAGRTTPIGDAPLDLAVAGALAIALALTWNFTLNRYLTFSYAKRGSVIRQFSTYVLSNALGIALSFTLRLALPRYYTFFRDHRLAAAVVGIVAATGISFTMSRWLVFRPGAARAATVTPTADPDAEVDAAEPVASEAV